MSNYSIFIVDDDPQMVELMSSWLMAEGHNVASDTAGSTALPQIALQKPDAVLVDLMMAQVNGLELVGELRSRPESKDTAVVMVSARTDGLWADRALDAGADGFIHKPLKREEFVLKVCEFIEAKKAVV